MLTDRLIVSNASISLISKIWIAFISANMIIKQTHGSRWMNEGMASVTSQECPAALPAGEILRSKKKFMQWFLFMDCSPPKQSPVDTQPLNREEYAQPLWIMLFIKNSRTQSIFFICVNRRHQHYPPDNWDSTSLLDWHIHKVRRWIGGSVLTCVVFSVFPPNATLTTQVLNWFFSPQTPI